MNQAQKNKAQKRSIIEVSSIPQMAQSPSGVESEAYAKARIAEILLMKQELEQGEYRGTKRVFQTLPRTMRRRAASHNINRLPVRLRERALAELNKDPSSAPKKIKKPPCRRRRRRTTNIMKEFGHRQQSKLWLSTHLWHSKRNYMEDIWGYRIAIKSNEKCRKSCIRASQEGVFLYDASYWEIFHFSSSSINEYIEAGLKIFPQNAHGMFKLSGINSMNTFVMNTDGSVLCPSLLAIFCGNENGRDTYSFFFTVHPLVSNTVTEIFIKHPLLAANIKHFKGKYCMFEMEGKKCDQLLQSRFLHSNNSESPSVIMQQISDLRYFEHSSQSESFKSFPISWKEFWNNEELSSKFSSRKSQKQINDLRSKMLPGIPIIPSPTEDPSIPLMIVRLNFASNSIPRYKIISLSEWGIDIWRNLVHSKVRVGALEEYEAVQLENSRLVFPRDYTICKKAFSEYSLQYFDRLKSEWERKPPAKRVNYQSLGISEPFSMCLSQDNQFTLCFIEMDKQSVPEWNSKVYLDERLVGFVTSGCYSQLKGKGVCIISILRDALHSTSCPIPISIQLPSSTVQRPAKITTFIH